MAGIAIVEETRAAAAMAEEMKVFML